MSRLLYAAGCSACTLLLYFAIVEDFNIKTQKNKGFKDNIQRDVGVRFNFAHCIEKQDGAFFMPFVIKYTLSGRAEPCPYSKHFLKQSLFIKTTKRSMTSITQTETTMKTEFILFTGIFSSSMSRVQAEVNKQNSLEINNGIATKTIC
ncbi:hypothetical protein [Dysgonomonas macrotermitis]|uniref:Uncharacterized protein n=1 Tax=Dysgonomonas macrotermitis TaxID=1346286 RepID=A0A1M4ZFI9_9BACT|nr:hypothetical protein [Dysgonomonas macrotermitis]SHF16562.1 hypothetical protein SAMN05444362_10470 [Dysgonomonas macrotermitis]